MFYFNEDFVRPSSGCLNTHGDGVEQSALQTIILSFEVKELIISLDIKLEDIRYFTNCEIQ